MHIAGAALTSENSTAFAIFLDALPVKISAPIVFRTAAGQFQQIHHAEAGMFPVDTSGKETAWPRWRAHVPAVSRQFGCDMPGTEARSGTSGAFCLKENGVKRIHAASTASGRPGSRQAGISPQLIRCVLMTHGKLSLPEPAGSGESGEGCTKQRGLARRC
jgi:hypothetical protein